jgi:serine/threonine-protein kinase
VPAGTPPLQTTCGGGKAAVGITLTVTEGPHTGASFTFAEHDTFLVGRSPPSHFRLPVKDSAISRVHFMVEVNPPQCRLLDMASSNGTFVNGRKVRDVELRDGDRIRIGKTSFAVSIGKSRLGETLEFPGRTAADPWEMDGAVPGHTIVRELGRGGMGVVFLGHSQSDGSAVALKVIRPGRSGDSEAVDRFLREVSILRRLDHPGIVRFREIGHTAGRLYFVMEYVPGENAADLIRPGDRPAPVDLAVDLACQVLDALTYAHKLRVVHRDIKPHNLLVCEVDGRPRVKVADFGLARIYHASTISGLTLVGQAGGTVGFMPPVQITDFRLATPAADLYSLGATLYWLLTAEHVFNLPADRNGQFREILEGSPVPIQDRRADVPRRLAAAIHRALEKEPDKRFPDSLAMRAALDPFRSL